MKILYEFNTYGDCPYVYEKWWCTYPDPDDRRAKTCKCNSGSLQGCIIDQEVMTQAILDEADLIRLSQIVDEKNPELG